MSLLSQVSASLLAPNDLDEGRLQQLLGSLMSHQVEFGDLYFQRSWHESWMLEDGIVKDGSYNIDQGVGVRAVSGEKTGFAYSDELSLLALQQSVTAARGIAAAGAQGKVKAWARKIGHLLLGQPRCKTRAAKMVADQPQCFFFRLHVMPLRIITVALI